MRLPVVLLYHAVAPRPHDADEVERGLFVDPEAFCAQMNGLAKRGFVTLTLDQFASAVGGAPAPPKSFLLTFDDGYAHVEPVVSPILKRHGFTAVMFACWQPLGTRNTWDPLHRNLSRLEITSHDQLAAMAAGPWEIACHGLRHADLRGLNRSQRQAELIEVRDRLSDLTKKPVFDLAYPYGYDDAEVRADARLSGYRMAFTAVPGNNQDRFHLSRCPIRGDDSLVAFRLKTIALSDRIYRTRRLWPNWARRTARGFLSI
jgi:peptidoglycan/xylan/chitin deacetylase (PgdA/CDA1 family)